MALVRCPECGREVSERASSCPECGCPLQGESTGIATLIFYRTGFYTPFQSIRVEDESGNKLCDDFRATSLPKKEKVALKVSVIGPTDITVSFFEYKSGFVMSSNKRLYKETCTVEPNRSYLITAETGSFTFEEV